VPALWTFPDPSRLVSAGFSCPSGQTDGRPSPLKRSNRRFPSAGLPQQLFKIGDAAPVCLVLAQRNAAVHKFEIVSLRSVDYCMLCTAI